MNIAVPIESAIPVRRPCGCIVTFINQSAIDVFFDTDAGRVNSVVPGGLSINGTRLAANGGEKEFKSYPGVVWFRALIATTIEVQD